MSKFNILKKKDVGNNVPRRNEKIVPILSSLLMKGMGWKVVGNVPDVKQAVLLCVPHTSNLDALYTLPTIFSLDLNVNILGKKSLFNNPVVGSFLKWSGVIPIDRSKKGSVLQSQIDLFKSGEPLFLALAPEGTRDYTTDWRTGFYYLALGANVPMLPIVMDYKTKEVRFANLIYPSGDIEADMPKILANYIGVVPKYPENLSQPLQDLNKDLNQK